jgi:hypothetical protein
MLIAGMITSFILEIFKFLIFKIFASTSFHVPPRSSSNLSPIEKGIPIDEYSKKDVGVEKISKETVVSYKNSTYDSIIKTYEDKIKPQLLKIKNN